MEIKQVYQKGKYKEVDIDASRTTLQWIQHMFSDREVSPSEIAEDLKISRETAVGRLNRLVKNGFLKSRKRVKDPRVRDYKVYKLTEKGESQLPRGKSTEKEEKPKVEYIDREVSVERKYKRTVMPDEEV